MNLNFNPDTNSLEKETTFYEDIKTIRERGDASTDTLQWINWAERWIPVLLERKICKYLPLAHRYKDGTLILEWPSYCIVVEFTEGNFIKVDRVIGAEKSWSEAQIYSFQVSNGFDDKELETLIENTMALFVFPSLDMQQ